VVASVLGRAGVQSTRVMIGVLGKVVLDRLGFVGDLGSWETWVRERLGFVV
jgi:hypothetical protein